MRDSEVDEAYQIIDVLIDRRRSVPRIGPEDIAGEALVRMNFPVDLHPLGYRLAHLQCRQIARSMLHRKFDRRDYEVIAEDDLFPETLQERYPRQHRQGEDPEYILLDHLTEADVAWNIDRLRSAGNALLKHADALAAWSMKRRAA